MIGIFDSGRGGENVLKIMRDMGVRTDVVFLKDEKRAPYGTKSENQIVRICEENVQRLLDYGAKRVVIACCTASTVHHRLPKELRQASLPIIAATAKEALKLSSPEDIAVIATERTVSSHSFGAAIGEGTLEICAQFLVRAVEDGQRDGCVSDRTLSEIDALLDSREAEGRSTLVLGCTHFHALRKTLAAVGKAHGIKQIISSAQAAAILAKEAAEDCTDLGGRDIFLN